MKTLEKRQARAKLIHDARQLLDRAEKEKRTLTADEEGQWAKFNDEIDALGTQIEREELQAKRELELGEDMPRSGSSRAAGAQAAQLEAVQIGGHQVGVRRSYAPGAFRSFALGEAGPKMEFRALQMDDPAAGGYTVQAEEFVARLIKFMDNLVFIRGLATVLPVTTAESVGVPSLDTDIADADWTSELATGNEDSSMAFGKRELRPHPLAKRIKLSQKLLRSSAIAVEDLVRARLGYKFGVTQEKGFLTGTGTGQPLGVFTASTNGISTGRDVATGNSSTAIGADGLIEAKYSLKMQYWPKASWIFNRVGLKNIRKLKDGDGQYLWRPGLIDGQPDQLLDSPFYMSEYAPSTFTTGNYVGIIGDFSFYWIVDALGMTVQRLVELYAETNQVGFIGRMESDGMPVLEEAFARVTLA